MCKLHEFHVQVVLMSWGPCGGHVQVIRRSPTGRMEVIGGRMEDIQVVWRSYGGHIGLTEARYRPYSCVEVIQVVWR